jgi:G3E family GTPase
MQLNLLGGFLGSGKSTAIVNASRELVAQGKRVGILTNDQGKYLVDTSFANFHHLPVAEVTGGCFCCNFDDFESRVQQISREHAPDVIFAESVGSCADLVATVVKPFLNFQPSREQRTTLSVFVDCRLLDLFLQGEELPFSEEVAYIFQQQIEETALLVINKIDLLPTVKWPILASLAQARFPRKKIILQNSRDVQQVIAWVNLLDNFQNSQPQDSINLDYEKYGKGESKMAWLDGSIRFEIRGQPSPALIMEILGLVVKQAGSQLSSIGHLKFFIRCLNGAAVKFSLTEMDDKTAFLENAAKSLQDLNDSIVEMIINLRGEGDAKKLESAIRSDIEKMCVHRAGNIVHLSINGFHPRQPKPTYHLP